MSECTCMYDFELVCECGCDYCAEHCPVAADEGDDMNGHEESEDCWCCPRVERYESGNLIIHNEEN